MSIKPEFDVLLLLNSEGMGVPKVGMDDVFDITRSCFEDLCVEFENAGRIDRGRGAWDAWSERAEFERDRLVPFIFIDCSWYCGGGWPYWFVWLLWLLWLL